MARGSSDIPVDLKYELYEGSVQCHESDIEFINEQFKKFRGREAKVLREDFGGTGALACDWTKQGSDFQAYAVDLDVEPISYGQKTHYQTLNDEEKERMKYIEGNVLDNFSFKADVLVAFNFSYFIFKKRQLLKDYFQKAYEGLKDDGVFMVDIFGGTECFQECVEETEHDDHSYYWDCDNYNPLTNEVLYYIHFKTHKDKKKYNKVFTYDWRHWSVREITELMEEVGFSKVVTYWEGEDEDGDGDGNFFESTVEENCESWVIYIAGLK
tara:strand:- start:65555 stop:66361 length:807 start_codon:yes stop_codon:yes gene_type:complete